MELLSYWIPWPVGDSDDCGWRVSSREDKEYGSNRIASSSMPALRVRIAGERREGTGAKRLAKAELSRMAGGERLIVMALSNPEFTEDRCGLVLHRYGYLLGRLALSLEA
jgi:hypothetical protein